jgi:hypothetical protein
LSAHDEGHAPADDYDEEKNAADSRIVNSALRRCESTYHQPNEIKGAPERRTSQATTRRPFRTFGFELGLRSRKKMRLRLN